MSFDQNDSDTIRAQTDAEFARLLRNYVLAAQAAAPTDGLDVSNINQHKNRASKARAKSAMISFLEECGAARQNHSN